MPRLDDVAKAQMANDDAKTLRYCCGCHIINFSVYGPYIDVILAAVIFRHHLVDSEIISPPYIFLMASLILGAGVLTYDK